MSKLRRLRPGCAILVSALVAQALWLAGCTSKPAATPGASPPTPALSTPTPAPAAPLSADDLLKRAAAQPLAAFPGEGWQSMFDGESLRGWRETLFAGRGEIECKSGLLILEMGNPFTGVNWTSEFPKLNYEVALEAMRVMGSDFFCGLTVPVGDSFCSLIMGGWGGSLVGVSSLDSLDASENETTKYMNFETGRWYRVRLRVTTARIECWLDDEKIIDVVTTERKISLRPGEIEMSKPFGLASWQTMAAMRHIQWRAVEGPADAKRRRTE